MENKNDLVWRSKRDGSILNNVTLYDIDDYIVERVDRGNAISKYTGNDENIVIPDALNEVLVISLGSDNPLKALIHVNITRFLRNSCDFIIIL